ncbi:MAG: tetratricopeptide repeat protein [Cyanobacteria bacterium SID2]|nr:tetratricopeptide repeat protein [Cyanobacteria bacterium SID2]MBP0005335.1 tetratricopeptide repeat protein [Cyanobacteria bacterium SBC]
MFNQTTQTYFSFGNKLWREEKLNEAIAAYQCSIKHTPNFYVSHHNLGEVLSQQGRLEEAIVAYRRAIELKPDSAATHNQLQERLANHYYAKT